MKSVRVIISLLVMSWSSAEAADNLQSIFESTSRNGVEPRLEIEAGVALPDGQYQPSLYGALLLRKRSDFFGWPSHRLYEIGGIVKDSCETECEHSGNDAMRSYSFETAIVGISEQFEVFRTAYFSVEVGLGGYLKKPTDAVGSTFTFGERVALRSTSDKFQLEVFYRHFSNGSFTSDNRGYDFVGFAFQSRF